MVNQMIATVQLYIHQRKNVEVNIAIRNNSDLVKLTKAYNIATNWLNNNGFVQIV